MTIIRGALVCLYFFLILPLLYGYGLGAKKRLDQLLIGFCAVQAVYYPAGLLLIFLKVSARWMTGMEMALLTGLALLLAICRRQRREQNNRKVAGNPKEGTFFLRTYGIWILPALLLIGLQIYRSVVLEPYIYGDDTTYIRMITNIVETDSVYLKTWTGQLTPDVLSSISYKYLYTTYYPFLASISLLSGIHPLILCKSILPCIYLPFHYLVVWRISGYLFSGAENGKKRGLFLFFYTVFIEWGLISYNTISRRMMMWIWNSKSLLFGILLPLLFFYSYLFMEDFEKPKEERGSLWILLICSLSSISASLMGVLFVPVILGIFILRTGFIERNLRKTAFLLLGILPPALIALRIVFLLKG